MGLFRLPGLGQRSAAATHANAFQLASSMLGKTEGTDHAAVMDYLKTGGQNLDPATTAWCAAFVNSSLQKAGYKTTGSNLAKSFANYGSAVTGAPQQGDIAVFNRGDPNSPYGHVGFVQSFDPKTGQIQLLAGNQGNAVSVRPYALSSAVAIRRPGDASAAPADGGGTIAPATPVSPGQQVANRFNASPGMQMVNKLRSAVTGQPEAAMPPAADGGEQKPQTLGGLMGTLSSTMGQMAPQGQAMAVPDLLPQGGGQQQGGSLQDYIQKYIAQRMQGQGGGGGYG